MDNRLRRMLRLQFYTQDNEPEDRFEVDMSKELMYILAETSYRRSRAMGRMNEALDRYSDRIYDLEEMVNLLFGELTDLNNAAKEFRNALTENDGKFTSDQLETFCSQIAKTDGLIETITENMEGLEEAEEEEKDD